MKKVILRALAILCALVTIVGMCSIIALAAGNPVYVGWSSLKDIDVERKTMNTDISCMTFNVLHYITSNSYTFANGNFDERVKYAVKMIQTYSPDIIGIQEAGDDVNHGVNWPKNLKNKLGSQYSSIMLTDQSDRSAMFITSGLMIFYDKSRFALCDDGATCYYSCSNKCGKEASDRWYQWVKLKIIDKEDPNYGQMVYVFNTHLSTNHTSSGCGICSDGAERGKYWRTQEMLALGKKINSIAKNYPCFVTGDFNCTYASTTATERSTQLNNYGQLYALTDNYKYMQSALMTADLQTNTSASNCIDHIFYNTSYLHCKKLARILESNNYTSGSNSTGTGYSGSDHYPQIAYFKFTPDITITSPAGTHEYDPINLTYTDTFSDSDLRQYSFEKITVPAGIDYTVHRVDEITGESTPVGKTPWLVKHTNKLQIKFTHTDSSTNATSHFATVNATIYNNTTDDFAKLPKLQTQGAINHYFANHAYHVVVDKDTTEAIVTPSCPSSVTGEIYDEDFRKITNNRITNIQPGRTLYYVKKTFYNGDGSLNHTEAIPLYVYRETAEPYMGRAANTDGTRRVLYIDQNIGSATGPVAFWDGKDVRLVDGQVNAFDALADVNSKLTTYSNYEVYMASGTYKASTTTYKHAVHFFGVNHDESPNKRILEGIWELVDRG